jgi:membrane fusion protein (multidrug efflux system)
MAPKDINCDEVKETATVQRQSAEQDATPLLEPQRNLRRYIGIGLLALIGPLLAVAVGFYVYLSGGRYISTDNAYVKSAKLVVSADISGRVTKVAVQENQAVASGDFLFQIDPAPFQIAVDRANARLLAARQSVKALRAVYKQKQENLTRAQGDVVFYRQQLRRQKQLAQKKLVSGLNLDNAMRNLRISLHRVSLAVQSLAEVGAKLGGDPKLLVDSHPTVRDALADRDKAALDLKNTAVHASIHGFVTNFDLQPGEYVKAGLPIFSLVGADNTWVHANYKETELTYVRVGQLAKISIDTYPDKTFVATVAGISPATGAEFALLPPQNATGNWVKVVQRLTVRLKLDEPVDVRKGRSGPVLRAGMSAIVEIDTQHKRHLSGMLAVVADWATGLVKGNL